MIITVIPYCSKDIEATERLLNWIKDLTAPNDPVVEDCCLLAADSQVDKAKMVELNSLAKQSFKHVETMIVTVPEVKDQSYHVPAAQMFAAAARQVSECYKWPWLWLEPDAVPLKDYWLTALRDAYLVSPKRFMGALITTTQPGVPQVHMAGCGIYPNDAYEDLKKFCDGKNHFDMAMAPYVVPRALNTPLIWHRWGAPDDVPTFKEVKLATDGPNVGTLDMIPKEAVIFHRTKDSGLIDLLRKQMHSQPTEGIRSMTVVKKDYPNWGNAVTVTEQPPKKRMGRPPKVKPELEPVAT